MDVLRGASNLLAHRHVAWQLEISPSLLAGAGASAAAVFGICETCFTHFIDLGKRAVEGPRARPTDDLRQALAYLEGDEQTDIILFNAEGRLDVSDVRQDADPLQQGHR
jgi:hypothetical protein